MHYFIANMSHTIEQQRQRVEQEITKMFDDLDKTYLRKMQVKNFAAPNVLLFNICEYMRLCF